MKRRFFKISQESYGMAVKPIGKRAAENSVRLIVPEKPLCILDEFELRSFMASARVMLNRHTKLGSNV